jgi:hypothetical protein
VVFLGAKYELADEFDMYKLIKYYCNLPVYIQEGMALLEHSDKGC